MMITSRSSICEPLPITTSVLYPARTTMAWGAKVFVIKYHDVLNVVVVEKGRSGHFYGAEFVTFVERRTN